LSYVHGQLLTAIDLQTEQAYFREKLKLHNRCLHGYGIVCGLDISPAPTPKDCESEAERERAEREQKVEQIRTQLTALDRIASTGQPTEKELQEVAGERDRLGAWLEYEQRRLPGPPWKTPAHRPPGPCIVIGCGVALDCA